MLYRIMLELAQSREFPNGNRNCGYELQLPLTLDHRLDYCACRRRRHSQIICRFCPEEEWRGELKCDHRGWFLAFGLGEAVDAAILGRTQLAFGQGEAAQTAILGRTRFIVGEWIPITEFDGQTRHFRVVEVDRIQPHGDLTSHKTNRPSGSIVDKTTWGVGAVDDTVLGESGVPRRYGEFVDAGSQGVSEKTNKSPDMVGHVSRRPLGLAGALPISDRFEIAATDSFPASDAPGWTAVTGTGAPRASEGPLDIKDSSS